MLFYIFLMGGGGFVKNLTQQRGKYHIQRYRPLHRGLGGSKWLIFPLRTY